jgi:hypothetical protein
MIFYFWTVTWTGFISEEGRPRNHVTKIFSNIGSHTNCTAYMNFGLFTRKLFFFQSLFSPKHSITYMSDSRRGFGLHMGFIDHHLYTRLGTTSNYGAIANLHNSQIITAPAMSFPERCVFIGCFLATASKSGDSSASRSQDLSERRLPSKYFFPHRLS